MTNKFAIVGSRGFPSTYGGFETFVRHLAPYLVAAGDDVTVYCRDGRTGVAVRDGVRCVATRGIEAKCYSTLSYGLTAALHARRERYDAALVLNVANGFFLPMLRRAGIPTAVNVDGIEWRRAKWGRVGKATFRTGAALTAKHATEIVVDSREIGRVWRTDLGRDSTYIPYGADVTYDVPDDRVRQLGLEPGRYALVVARLVPENNVDLFLDALDRIGSNCPAVVVGGSRQDTELVARLRARARARTDFRWLGHVSDGALLEQLWSHCGVYFHGHSAGGTNPSLLQALGHGAPTIALNTPFNAEVIDNPRQLVPADPSVIAGRLTATIKTGFVRRSLADHGRRLVGERFTWDGVCAAYRKLLIDLAEGP